MQALQDMLQPKTAIDIPFVPKYVEELLLWRDAKKSGILFGACSGIALFFFITKMSLPTFFCYLAALVVIAATIWARFGASIGTPLPKLPALISEGMSEADYRNYCDHLKPEIDMVTGNLHKIVTCKDFVFNAKLIGGLAVMGKIFSFISPGVLGFLIVLVAFTGPKIYEMHKEKIDEGVVVAQGKMNEGMAYTKAEAGKIWEKAPPGLKKVADRFTPKKTE